MWVVGLPFVLVGAILVPIGLVLGCVSLVLASRRSGEARRRSLLLAAIWLIAAAALVAVPWVAAPYAETSNEWSDRDGDGMLHDMSNGSYDWVDVNGSTWVGAAGFLAALIIGALAISVAVVEYGWRPLRGPGEAEHRDDDLAEGLQWSGHRRDTRH